MINERRAALEKICRAMGVSILYAFGSRAQEIANWIDQRDQQLALSSSDVDIGARAAPGIFWSVKDKVDLALALEDLFDVPRADLVVLNEADPFVAAEVIRGERLFATDSTDADEYDLYVLRRAGDLAPMERERLDMILRISS
jgi:hypothetical protein